MNWKETIEESPIVWLLGVAITAFVAGFGGYQAILSVSGRETVESGSYVLQKDLAERCSRLLAGGDSQTSRVKEYNRLADDLRQLVVEGEALSKEGKRFSFTKLTSWMDRTEMALNDPKLGTSSDFKPFRLVTLYAGSTVTLSDKDQAESLRMIETTTEFLRGYEFLVRRVASSQDATLPKPLPKLYDLGSSR